MSKRFSAIFLIIFLILVFVLPLSPVFAKSNHLQGYERAKGKELVATDPLGWPIKVAASVHINATLQSFPGMTVIRLKPYNPWWRFLKKIPEQTTIVVSGLPVNTDLHIYTRGYRDHEVKKTDTTGTLS